MLAALAAVLVLATTLVWATNAWSRPIPKNQTIKIQVLSTNDFMYNGGDSYTTFQQGTNPVIYSDELLYDMITGYVRQFSPIGQQIEGRITTQ